MPRGVNHFRIGEAILLGTSAIDHTRFPELYQDTFTIRSEIIECQFKPSVPIGELGLDGFGQTPKFVDKGIRRRAILALGQQDIRLRALQPVDPQIEILGACSDHLVVDVTEATRPYEVGGSIEFYLEYGALLAATTSKYVLKECVNHA